MTKKIDQKKVYDLVCCVCKKRAQYLYEYTTSDVNDLTFVVCDWCRRVITQRARGMRVIHILKNAYNMSLEKKTSLSVAITFLLLNIKNKKENHDNQGKLSKPFDGRFYDLSAEECAIVRDISKNEGIDFGFAYNVFKNRYSVYEAKRRQALKNRENSGKSTDIYEVSKRLPGSFK